jgi:hypothetical protein
MIDIPSVKPLHDLDCLVCHEKNFALHPIGMGIILDIPEWQHNELQV